MTLDTETQSALLDAARRGAKQRRFRRRARAGSLAVAFLIGGLALFLDPWFRNPGAPTPSPEPAPAQLADARVVSVQTPVLAQVVQSRPIPSSWIVSNKDQSHRRLDDQQLLAELEQAGRTASYIRTPDEFLVYGLD